jgi:hypothetical protein
LIVWPSSFSMNSDVRIDNGIEMQTISVLANCRGTAESSTP